LRTLAIVAVLAVAGVAAAGAAIVLGSASLAGCPDALLAGTLQANAAAVGLSVRQDNGEVVSVAWPIGYGVGSGQNGEPVLTRLFVEVAKPGDRVSMGGGQGSSTDFQACGVVSVGRDRRRARGLACTA
jgi:hypothetical protein